MPFWYSGGLVVLGVETWLYRHTSGLQLLLTATSIWFFSTLGSILFLVPLNNRVIAASAGWQGKRALPIDTVANAYLDFARASPALYEAMFSLRLSVPFDDPATPSELRFAFAQLLALFADQGRRSPVLAELFWASLHGIAELTRNKRFPPKRQKERLSELVEVFRLTAEGRRTRPSGATNQPSKKAIGLVSQTST